MIRDRNSFVALGLAVSLFLVGKAAAQTLYVHAGAAGANNGSSWSDAYNSLQDALAHAASSGGAVTEIWVAAGTYMPDGGYTPVGGVHVPGSGDRTATFQLLNGVALYGGFAGVETMRSQRNITANETILSGDLAGDDVPIECTSPMHCSGLGTFCVDNFCIIASNNTENSYHVVMGSGTDVTAVMDGFTITAGNADGVFPNGQGGGMFNDFGSPKVANCTFHGNLAHFEGGAMWNSSGNPLITNCTFKANRSNAPGGGIGNIIASPTISGSTFMWNWGGGMANYFSSSNPTVTGCLFYNNRTQGGSGGGMGNFGGSAPTVAYCIFSQNSASAGGGMSISSSNTIVIESVFIGNSASFGGGIYNSTSSPTIANCMFLNNRASSSSSGGGGMANNTNSSPLVINCIFSGNRTAGLGRGAGMANTNDSHPTIINCSFSANSAAQEGGGLWNQSMSSPVVTNSIFWGNTDVNGSGATAQIHTVSGTPVVNHSIVQGGWSGAGGVGVLDVDPMFVDPLGPDGLPGTEDDNLRLLAGSPAIDAGDNAAVPSEVFADLDGHERIAYGTVDMGAYEYCPIQRLYGDVNDSGTVNFADISLIIDVFRGVPAAITFDDADIYPCGGDGNVNFGDVSAGIDAFRGSPPCPNTCH